VPRSSHGEREPAPGRRDPVDVLEDQAQTRVPALVPIRYAALRHAADAGEVTAQAGL
jgi:hypothetical protein